MEEIFIFQYHQMFLLAIASGIWSLKLYQVNYFHFSSNLPLRIPITIYIYPGFGNMAPGLVSSEMLPFLRRPSFSFWWCIFESVLAGVSKFKSRPGGPASMFAKHIHSTVCRVAMQLSSLVCQYHQCSQVYCNIQRYGCCGSPPAPNWHVVILAKKEVM